MRETFARRTRALGYIKRCLSTAGDPLGSQTQPWLDIIQVSRRDLLAFYETDVMRKRASRYYLLGCSLAPTLELTSSSEFARAVLTVMNEVESMGEGGEKDKTRMVSKCTPTRTGINGWGDWHVVLVGNRKDTAGRLP